MLFTHLYLVLREKIVVWFVFQQAEKTLLLNPQLFCLPTNSQKRWDGLLVRWTAKYVFFISQAMKIAASFSKFQCHFMLCCAFEITQNMVFQLLINFKSILSETILMKVSSGCLQIDYIRKLSKLISASFSKGVKFLIKELLCTHIVSHLLPCIS